MVAAAAATVRMRTRASTSEGKTSRKNCWLTQMGGAYEDGGDECGSQVRRDVQRNVRARGRQAQTQSAEQFHKKKSGDDAASEQERAATRARESLSQLSAAVAAAAAAAIAAAAIAVVGVERSNANRARARGGPNK